MVPLQIRRRIIASQLVLAGLLALLLDSGTAVADRRQEPNESRKDKRDKGSEPEPDEQYRRDAERVVAGIELEKLVDDEWVKVRRIEKPLLYYGDPTRNNDRGSVWAWGEKGRPV